MTNLNVASCAVLCWALFMSGLQGQTSSNPLPNFKIDKLVRFRDLSAAQERREKLISAIWPDGLPKSLPKLTDVAKDAPELTAIDKSLFKAARQLDVNVSDFDWHALVYVLTPTNAIKPNRLAIVHGGHMPEGVPNYLSSGLSDTANRLLAEGVTVALVQMPFVAWNNDTTATVAGHTVTITQRGSSGHVELFKQTEPLLQAGTMRFFLEPVVQTINQYLHETPQPAAIFMIGLSGGGWTTHMLAAVDVRIDVSIPVAGAMPMYARPLSPGSTGDSEQFYEPIFAEQDSDGDGVPETAAGIASWLEIFALGGIPAQAGRPRKQIQVLNLYDSCCFSGPVYESYATPLQNLVSKLDNSQWVIFIDDSHKDHIVSPQVLDRVLLPELRRQ